MTTPATRSGFIRRGEVQMDIQEALNRSTIKRGSDSRWQVQEDEFAQIGTTPPDQMSLDNRITELDTMLELAAKYPPAYGNTVGRPFFERASELMGRSLSLAETANPRSLILELAQKAPEMQQLVQHARAEELQRLLNEKPVEEIDAETLRSISQIIGRPATVGDVASIESRAALVFQVYDGVLAGALPKQSTMENIHNR
jgi:hypothetical protein